MFLIENGRARYLGVDINSAHAITSDPHTREELASVCKGVLVVPSSTIVLSSSFSVGVHVDRTSIQEVLNRLISRDVRSNSSRNQDRNVLSLGYRLKVNNCFFQLCSDLMRFFCFCGTFKALAERVGYAKQ